MSKMKTASMLMSEVFCVNVCMHVFKRRSLYAEGGSRAQKHTNVFKGTKSKNYAKKRRLTTGSIGAQSGSGGSRSENAAILRSFFAGRKAAAERLPSLCFVYLAKKQRKKKQKNKKFSSDKDFPHNAAAARNFRRRERQMGSQKSSSAQTSHF